MPGPAEPRVIKRCLALPNDLRRPSHRGDKPRLIPANPHSVLKSGRIANLVDVSALHAILPRHRRSADAVDQASVGYGLPLKLVEADD